MQTGNGVVGKRPCLAASLLEMRAGKPVFVNQGGVMAYRTNDSRKNAFLSLICILCLACSFLMYSDESFARDRTETGKSAQTGKKAPTSREIWLERARNNVDFVRGKASWYGSDFHAGKTASGLPYDMYTFTAAHRTLPFGTIVRVTDQYNGKSVMVCVTDRGPFKKGRIIDMSYAAAGRIGLNTKGVSTVDLEVVSDSKGRPLNASQAFYVEHDSVTGPERYGPYETFADAAVIQEALLSAHPEANVVLDARQP